MVDALRVLFVTILAFAITALVTWMAYQIARSRRVVKMSPISDASARIKTGGGIYRSRFARTTDGEWWLHAPLENGHYVPLRVGEEVVIETVGAEGRLLFRTTITDRDAELKQIKIAIPEQIHGANRRAEVRHTNLSPKEVNVEGRKLKMCDLSNHGMCAETETPFIPGDWVKVEFPWAKQTFAWVLANEFRESVRVVRLRFEEPVQLPQK